MSSSPSRRQRRRFARNAPGRRCTFCNADVSKMFDPDGHVAKHLEAMYGVPRDAGRRTVRRTDRGIA